MTNTNKTAAEHGTEDADTWFEENIVYSGTDDGVIVTFATNDEALSIAANMRAGRAAMPDEALINAMGRRWVLEQATGDVGDDRIDRELDQVWAMYGVPWCRAYNEAYLARLEELATQS